MSVCGLSLLGAAVKPMANPRFLMRKCKRRIGGSKTMAAAGGHGVTAMSVIAPSYKTSKTL